MDAEEIVQGDVVHSLLHQYPLMPQPRPVDLTARVWVQIPQYLSKRPLLANYFIVLDLNLSPTAVIYCSIIYKQILYVLNVFISQEAFVFCFWFSSHKI